MVRNSLIKSATRSGCSSISRCSVAGRMHRMQRVGEVVGVGLIGGIELCGQKPSGLGPPVRCGKACTDIASNELVGQHRLVIDGLTSGQRPPKQRPPRPRPQHHRSDQRQLGDAHERQFLSRWPVVVGFRIG